MTTPNPDSGNANGAAKNGADKPAVESAGGGGPSRGLDAARARHSQQQRSNGNKSGGNGAARAGDNQRPVSAPAPAAQPYTSDAVRGLLALPFHALALAANDERMVLAPVEEKALADTGALVANAYLPVDPKTSALTLFLGTVTAIGLAKLGIWAEIRRARKEAEDARARTDKNTDGSPKLSAV